MKRTLVLMAIFVLATTVFTSCASSRGAKGGCKGSEGYIGYGHR